MIRLIAAIDNKRGLAKDGSMPWKLPEDEHYFTRMTKTYGGNVLTGGVTFRDAYHSNPLIGRQNYILTRGMEPIEGTIVVNDLTKLLADFAGRDLWVAGGAEVFAAIMTAGEADELYLTHIDADFDCDQFFPRYEHGFRLAEESQPHEQNGLKFTYARYVRAE